MKTLLPLPDLPKSEKEGSKEEDRERERARCASETAEEREEWLQRRRVRDRARRAAQSIEQRQATRQSRRDHIHHVELTNARRNYLKVPVRYRPNAARLKVKQNVSVIVHVH